MYFNGICRLVSSGFQSRDAQENPIFAVRKHPDKNSGGVRIHHTFSPSKTPLKNVPKKRTLLKVNFIFQPPISGNILVFRGSSSCCNNSFPNVKPRNKSSGTTLQALRWSTSAPLTNFCARRGRLGFCCLRCFQQKESCSLRMQQKYSKTKKL